MGKEKFNQIVVTRDDQSILMDESIGKVFQGKESLFLFDSTKNTK